MTFSNLLSTTVIIETQRVLTQKWIDELLRTQERVRLEQGLSALNFGMAHHVNFLPEP